MTKEEIIREFQKRQIRVSVAACVCFGVMVPLAIWARSIHDLLSIAVIVAFALVMGVFYFVTFRCPACNKLVKQRRRIQQVPLYCTNCKSLLEP